jgi:hypothetical protein
MEDPLPGSVFRQFGSEKLVLAFLIGFLLMTIAVVAAVTYVYQR